MKVQWDIVIRYSGELKSLPPMDEFMLFDEVNESVIKLKQLIERLRKENLKLSYSESKRIEF